MLNHLSRLRVQVGMSLEGMDSGRRSLLLQASFGARCQVQAQPRCPPTLGTPLPRPLGSTFAFVSAGPAVFLLLGNSGEGAAHVCWEQGPAGPSMSPG